MTEKTEFHGEVAQAVVGNVQEAPRLNNIVNFNVGNEKAEFKPLVPLQRKAISKKVDEVVAATTGMERLDVYAVIFLEFGAKKIAEISSDQYKAVMAVLDKWLVDAQGQTVLTHAQIEPEDLPALVPPTIPASSHCLGCEEKNNSIARLQRSGRAQLFALVAVVIGCGWLLYKMPSDTAPATASTMEQHCYADGKSYSVGSALKVPNVGVLKCVTDDVAPRWDDMQKAHPR